MGIWLGPARELGPGMVPDGGGQGAREGQVLPLTSDISHPGTLQSSFAGAMIWVFLLAFFPHFAPHDWITPAASDVRDCSMLISCPVSG